MRRILRTEARRGVAPLAAVLIAVVALITMFNDTEMWAGRWAALAGYLRVVMIVVVPLALAAGAWQGGRDRRRRIGELLTSTPRPPWQRLTVGWAAGAAGAAGGFLLAGAACAVLVARVATYSSGGWWWLVVVGLAGLAAASAVGFAAGVLLPWRLTAPVAGLAGYVGLGVLTYVDDGRVWLSPALGGVADGSYLPVGEHLWQAAWFVLLAATALAAVGSRHRRPVVMTAVAPAAALAVLAVAAGVVVASGPAHDRWRPDPVAREPVCAAGDPQVCTTRETEFLLGELAATAQATLAPLTGIDGVPDRLHAVVFFDGREERAAYTYLRPYISWSGTLSPTGEYGAVLETDLVRTMLPDRFCDRGADDATAMLMSDLADVVLWWTGVDPAADGVEWTDGGSYIVESSDDGSTGAQRAELDSVALHERLAGWPRPEQERWVERYVAAGRACDLTALAALRGELA